MLVTCQRKNINQAHKRIDKIPKKKYASLMSNMILMICYCIFLTKNPLLSFSFKKQSFIIFQRMLSPYLNKTLEPHEKT